MRSTRQLGRAVLERCLLDLAPGGGCQPRRSPAALVRSYRTVSPLPARLAPRGRSALCCPVREVAPAWLSPAPCPAESGLSSSDRDRPRPPGRLLHGRGYPRRRLRHDDASCARSGGRGARGDRERVREPGRGAGEPGAAPPSCAARPPCCRRRCARTTLRFVEAYRATVLGGDDLEGMAATPLMRRFAYWLGVTNRAFPGEITATSTVNALGPATAICDDGRVLEVQLSAQVDVVAQPPEGEPLQFSVPLDGPVRLAATEPGHLARDRLRSVRGADERSVPAARPRCTSDPACASRSTAFGGVPTWSFFVRIAATGPQVLTLDEADVTLVDARRRGGRQGDRGLEPLLEIAPGGHIDGALTFEPLADARGVSLRIDLGGPGDPVPLEIPLRSVLDGRGATREPAARSEARAVQRAASYSSTPRFARRSASVLRSRRTCSYSIESNRAPSSRTRRCRGCRCGVFTR